MHCSPQYIIIIYSMACRMCVQHLRRVSQSLSTLPTSFAISIHTLTTDAVSVHAGSEWPERNGNSRVCFYLFLIIFFLLLFGDCLARVCVREINQASGIDMTLWVRSQRHAMTYTQREHWNALLTVFDSNIYWYTLFFSSFVERADAVLFIRSQC